MRKHYGLLTIALLAGCAGKGDLVRTEVVELPRSVYVPIPAELTQPCPIAEGPLAKAVEVARQRRESLEACNGKLRAIRELGDKAEAQRAGK